MLTFYVSHQSQRKKTGNNMKRFQAMPLLLSLVLASTVGVAGAQATDSSPTTRKEVKMETAEFLKTHQWDATKEAWYMKPEFEAPTGVKPRSEVKAERDAFLRDHRWDDTKQAWEQLPQPRDMSTLTRAQVKAETAMFLKTHSYDEGSGAWKPAK